MSLIQRRLPRILWLAGPLVQIFALACSEDFHAPPPPQATGFSVAYGIWAPGPGDTCPADVHNQYSVAGPDGKLYPT